MAQTSRKAKRHKNEKRTADKHLHKNSIKISLLEWTIKIALIARNFMALTEISTTE